MQLTIPEKLFTHRRRNGLTQTDMANSVGLTLQRYNQIEKGHVEPTSLVRSRATGLGKLTMAEKCVILRRRAEYRIADVAHDLGVSKNWLGQMEKGKQPVSEALANYWGI